MSAIELWKRSVQHSERVTALLVSFDGTDGGEASRVIREALHEARATSAALESLSRRMAGVPASRTGQ
jgi:hypothetical protein